MASIVFRQENRYSNFWCVSSPHHEQFIAIKTQDLYIYHTAVCCFGHFFTIFFKCRYFLTNNGILFYVHDSHISVVSSSVIVGTTLLCHSLKDSGIGYSPLDQASTYHSGQWLSPYP